MSSPLLQISYSLANIESAVHQFWQYTHQYRVFAFTGDLGAGKTTFITTLCKILGVHENPSSPTFALVNEYRIQENNNASVIYHMDWYRIKDAQDAIYTGFEDYFTNTNAYFFIEWPEKATEIIPSPYIQVSLETISATERNLTAYVKA